MAQGGAMGAGGEFVVIEHLETVRNVQLGIKDEIKELRKRLETIEIRSCLGIHAYELQARLWRIFLSFVTICGPILIAFLWDHRNRNVGFSYTPVQEFEDNLLALMMAFALCVGIPLFVYHIFEYVEARLVTHHDYQKIHCMGENEDEDDDERTPRVKNPREPGLESNEDTSDVDMSDDDGKPKSPKIATPIKLLPPLL